MMTLYGEKELIAKFAKIEARTQKRALSKANSKAIRPVVRAAKAAARETSNTIAKAIGIRNKKYRKGSIHTVVVGVRNSANHAAMRPHTNFVTGQVGTRKHDPRNTAHLVEKGTKPHAIVIPRFKMIVRHPGTRPKPFLEPALTRNVLVITRIHADTLKSEIMAAAK